MKLLGLFACAVVTGCLHMSDVFASTIKEQIKCTDQPRTTWMSEEKIRSIFRAEKYLLVKFKVSRTNCYEFYAVAHSGEIVEAYYHPVTGALVKENHLQSATQPSQPPVVPNGKVR